MPSDMRARPVPVTVALGLALLSCGGGASTATSSSSTASTSVSTTAAGSNQSSGLRIALAAQGAPNPSDSGFVSDQQGLFDPSQFTDANLYPPGYHWKIDRQFRPTDGASAMARTGQLGSWELVLTFTSSGSARFNADTQIAFGAPQGSALNRLAFFLGPRVIQAPSVVFPTQGSNTLIGGLTEQQAKSIAAELTRTRQP